ncbi:MAG TPA: polymer-forming cytoskeletal protein [Thermomicrobiales bacterium]|nr:polymer-forming cytoskeletal protein [Thermomicrobiales bacterium]
MVFRRDNKVDQFQRQMSALRHQIGGEAGSEQDEMDKDVPDIADDRFPNTRFNDSEQYDRQDAGGYSFGSYPAAPQDQDEDDLIDGALAVPDMPGVDSQISVVAQGALWKGDVEADGSIHVFGRVEGTLTAKEDIWLAEGSDVHAVVTARQVIVAGQVNGTVRALGRFEALPQGVVEADVQAPSFVVHEGATINGKLTMSSNDNTVSSGRAERAGSTPIVQRRMRPGS